MPDAVVTPVPPGSAFYEDSCPACGNQLAIFAGPCLASFPDGQLHAETRDGKVNGPLTDRARRERYIACGQCGQPVPVDHPRQRKLDAEWQAFEDAERKSAAAAGPSGTTPIYPQMEKQVTQTPRPDAKKKK